MDAETNECADGKKQVSVVAAFTGQSEASGGLGLNGNPRPMGCDGSKLLPQL